MDYDDGDGDDDDDDDGDGDGDGDKGIEPLLLSGVDGDGKRAQF